MATTRCLAVHSTWPFAETWYFTDKQEYLASLKAIGQVYRETIGRHFPAMAAMQVVALVEDRAKIEIQATAIIPE